MKQQRDQTDQLLPLQPKNSSDNAATASQLIPGTEIAYIQDKQELQQVLQQQFRSLGFSDDFAINIISEDLTSFRPFVIDTNKPRLNHPEYPNVASVFLPYPDGFFEQTIRSTKPLVFYLEDLLKKKGIPDYLQFLYDTGIREMVTIPLRDRNAPIGGFFIFSKTENKYSKHQFKLLRRIADQAGIAVFNIIAREVIIQRENEKSLLLSLSRDITSSRSKEAILDIIDNKLGSIFQYNAVTVSLLHENKINHAAYLYSFPQEMLNHPELAARAAEKYVVQDGVYETLLQAKGPIIFDLDELMQRRSIPGYVDFFYKNGIKEMVAFPISVNNETIGGVWLHSKIKGSFTKAKMDMAEAICAHISIAVANIRAYEAITRREQEKSFLLTVSRNITSCQTREDILNIIRDKLARLVHCDIILLCLNNEDKVTHSNYLHTIPEEIENHPDFAKMATLKYYINDGFYNVIQESDDPVIFDVDELITRKNKPFYFDFWHANNIKEMVGLSIRVNNQTIGAVVLHAKEKNTFNNPELKMAQGVCSHIGMALSNIIAYEKIQSQLKEINRYKSKLEEENLYLQEQIKTIYNNGEMVGSSPVLQRVFHLVSQVAASDSTVLITGETGTGKELIARAIHNASPRKSKLMVKVNCAALPSQLIESELFGHEKGSFTGALERRIGKFELANNSTLFLDEIGEMSLELQVKLLRAIQEKEIERVGGKEVIKTDVRIIVATNRNLQKEVEAGRFRSDLFYRLNVFPIYLPTLRERKEDIPALVNHFINKLCRKLGKQIDHISNKALQAMMQYDWPGNIRELEHLIERSVLLCSGNTINEIPLPGYDRGSSPTLNGNPTLKSLEQNEREHILAVLKKSNGKIRGSGGAAEILKVPPTTLHSKMKKLGIKKTVS